MESPVNIYMKHQTYYHKEDPYAHCATICKHQKGMLLAYYKGPECTNKQAVVIKYTEEGQMKAATQLYPKTGNCVLIPTNKNTATLIYSYFNDTDGITAPLKAVQRWMYCSNWIIKISYKDGTIKITDPMPFHTQPEIGYLTRCNPIRINQQWLLPIYHEGTCYGLIMKSRDGINWRTAGPIGLNHQKGKLTKGYLIQPCLWHDGIRLHSLSRDMSEHNYAWYSISYDEGETWSKIIPTRISNTNNSLITIHDGTESPWIIWNLGRGRNQLVLGKWDRKDDIEIPYLRLNKGLTGSYPNYAFDDNGDLHIVHSNHGPIAHHIIDKEFLQSLNPSHETNN